MWEYDVGKSCQGEKGGMKQAQGAYGNDDDVGRVELWSGEGRR